MKVIPRLSVDLKNELPEEKGFSERNNKRMLRFFREYPSLRRPDGGLVPQPAALLKPANTEGTPIVPRAVAQLKTSPSEPVFQLIFSIPWAHNYILIEKIKDLPTGFWYARQTLASSLPSIEAIEAELSRDLGSENER